MSSGVGAEPNLMGEHGDLMLYFRTSRRRAPIDQTAHREGPRTNKAETRCLWCDTQRQEMRDVWAWEGETEREQEE